jgi:hypothetical protein
MRFCSPFHIFKEAGMVRNAYLVFVLYTVFTVQAYQSSQYVVPRGGIFLGKWRSSFAGISDGKVNVQSACALNTRWKR